jgi:hypothetical protein
VRDTGGFDTDSKHTGHPFCPSTSLPLTACRSDHIAQNCEAGNRGYSFVERPTALLTQLADTPAESVTNVTFHPQVFAVRYGVHFAYRI